MRRNSFLFMKHFECGISGLVWLWCSLTYLPVI